MPPLYFFIGLCLIVALGLIAPSAEFVSWSWRWAGALPVVLGIWLNLAADRAFKLRRTTIKPFEKSTALVTDGVFRVSRNPIYLGMVLILTGAAILSGQFLSFAVCAAFATLLHYRFILPEERMLKETFGDAFKAYCAGVRRWI